MYAGDRLPEAKMMAIGLPATPKEEERGPPSGRLICRCLTRGVDAGLAGTWCSSPSSTSMVQVCSSPGGEARDLGVVLADGASSVTGVIAMAPSASESDESSSWPPLRQDSYPEMVALRPWRSFCFCSISFFILLQADVLDSSLQACWRSSSSPWSWAWRKR